MDFWLIMLCCILDFAKSVKQNLKIQNDLHGVVFCVFIRRKVIVWRTFQKRMKSLSCSIRSSPNLSFPSWMSFFTALDGFSPLGDSDESSCTIDLKFILLSLRRYTPLSIYISYSMASPFSFSNKMLWFSGYPFRIMVTHAVSPGCSTTCPPVPPA